MEEGTAFAKATNYPAFPDAIRNQLYASMMNVSMGAVTSSSLFEYVHIVLTHNTEISEHIDWKNDHRIGYNICSVYSSFVNIDDLSYRLSIIMTTCTTLGAALEKARLN